MVTRQSLFVDRSPRNDRQRSGAPTRFVERGEVFHDGLGDLGRIRTALAYYPRDIWLYVLASRWQRIAQEEAFVGRRGQIGDDLGATVVAARLIRDLMRHCLLMERRYPPYSKWLGTAFSRLDCARFLAPLLTSALRASDTAELQQRLAVAYEAIAEKSADSAERASRAGAQPAVSDTPVVHRDRRRP
jgi:hypothetical protein